jgi:hypothetical protein
MSVLAAAASAPWAALTALPRLALAAARLRRARAARIKAPLPVACLTDAEAREADYALLEAAQTLEARPRVPQRAVMQRVHAHPCGGVACVVL